MTSDTLPGSRELATTHVKKVATGTTGLGLAGGVVFEQEFVTMYLHIFHYFLMHLILFKVSIPSGFQA